MPEAKNEIQTEFWQPLINFFRDTMLKQKLITQEDFELFRTADTPQRDINKFKIFMNDIEHSKKVTIMSSRKMPCIYPGTTKKSRKR